ncbi:MAG: bifunctional phosphopantothenoylcysteine decarboxylase/phosphopantothenate--cysteine ligase CoaBC [Bryobacteraceae bacterium]
MNAVLGVGGGIAAYKSAELARALMERGFRVQVVMTDAAREFIQPLTFAALTGNKVVTGLFSSASSEETLSSAIEHIAVAQDNEVLVVAPATADLLARFAHGLANDFLTTMYLAFTGEVVLAPAMNTNMWNHAATQENLQILRRRGHTVVAPDEGALACGMVGPGRLAEPVKIAEIVTHLLLRQHDLDGQTVLVTAGPTQEPIDPVRFITNRSSGRMGYAIAEAAAARGAKVILISGPVALAAPRGSETIRVDTAQQMHDAVLDRMREADIIVKAAAVSDYHAAEVSHEKMKKRGCGITLQLEPNPDILAELGMIKGDRLLVGFAAETQNLIAEGREKLIRKNCDMVVANLVGREDTGFDSPDNEAVLVFRDTAPVPLPKMSKRRLADLIFDQVLTLRRAAHATK